MTIVFLILHITLTEIEALIPSITDQNIRNAINSKIGEYKLKNAQKLQNIVCKINN